jgi:hypothetical protein
MCINAVALVLPHRNGSRASNITAAGGSRHLLQAAERALFIRSNTNQTIPIKGTNYQVGVGQGWRGDTSSGESD